MTTTKKSPLLRLSLLSAIVETNSQTCKTRWTPRVLTNRNKMLRGPHVFLINICGDVAGEGGGQLGSTRPRVSSWEMLKGAMEDDCYWNVRGPCDLIGCEPPGSG